MTSTPVPDPTLARTLHDRLAATIAARRPLFEMPPGEYFLQGSYLPERFCQISNNDHGLKRILFDVEGASDLTIEGHGARLVFFGEVLPIRVGHSAHLTIRNLTIDWHRPFFTQAEVTAGGAGFVEFQTDPERYPLAVDRGRLLVRDGRGWQTDSLWNLLPFDPVRREVDSREENWGLNRWHRASQLGLGRFRLEADFQTDFTIGQPIVLMHGNRVAPGVWIEESNGITLENVTLHHALAMGVIAQCSKNVTLDRLRVIPSGDRLFSTWVDATHFTDCHGHTVLKGCELRGQFDDAANIHATFYQVLGQLKPDTARLRTVHPQRCGVCGIKPGDGVAVHARSTLERLLVSKAVAVCQVNSEIQDLTMADPWPAGLECVVRRYEPGPENRVEVRHCRFGANRGRGLLLNMEHRTLIEDNHFHVSGRAIESVPDANYWWEAGPFENLTIRGNTFEDCNYGPCGDTLIHVGPELPDGGDPRQGTFHKVQEHGSQSSQPPVPVLRNLVIEGNTMIRHSKRLLFAAGLDGLVFKNNTIIESRNYPLLNNGPVFELGAGVTHADLQDPPSDR